MLDASQHVPRYETDHALRLRLRFPRTPPGHRKDVLRLLPRFRTVCTLDASTHTSRRRMESMRVRRLGPASRRAAAAGRGGTVRHRPTAVWRVINKNVTV